MDPNIAAIVLAAGMSRRMGEPKMVLPWGKRSVVGQVVRVISEASIRNIIVVTGGDRDLVEAALKEYPVRFAHNIRYQESEMVYSLQAGLKAVPEDTEAVLIALGDQPQIKLRVVESLVAEYISRLSGITIPSYQMRRGHPWIIKHTLWSELMAMHLILW